MHKIMGKLNHNKLMMLCLGLGIRNIYTFLFLLALVVFFHFYFKNVDYFRNIWSFKCIFVKAISVLIMFTFIILSQYVLPQDARVEAPKWYLSQLPPLLSRTNLRQARVIRGF